MDQQRPALSQSPLRMHHNTKNSGSSNNFSQKQLGMVGGSAATGAAAAHKASPIRESLIKNTGAFILGGAAAGGGANASGGNSGGTATASGAANTNSTIITHQPSAQQLALLNHGGGANNFSTNQPTSSGGAAAIGGAAANTNDLTGGQNGGNNHMYKRDRSADRAEFEYNTKDMNSNSRGDVLDNFMSLPKQQQMQIQMLTEQQQMAYITQHRAETSGVRMHNHNNQGHFTQLNSATFRGVPPSSGGTGAAAIAFNPLHQHQQQSSQPILHTTSKYGVGPSQPVIQARQSQVPQFSGIAAQAGVERGGGGTNGDSGSFSLQRNAAGGLLSQQDSATAKASKQTTIQNSPTKGETVAGGGDTIKNKRVFIENTVDSILQTKSTKTSSFMNNKPVGAMSGTGTTDVHPKVHSVSPRNNVGSSIVGLPNIVVGNNAAPGGPNNPAAGNNRSGGVSPSKEGTAAAAGANGNPAGGAADQSQNLGGAGQKNIAESQQPQRAADASRQVDDFLAETDKMTFM